MLLICLKCLGSFSERGTEGEEGNLIEIAIIYSIVINIVRVSIVSINQ